MLLFRVFLLTIFLKAALFADEPPFYHTVKFVIEDHALVILEDESAWKIGWWYTSKIKNWQEGHRINLSYNKNSSNPFKLENIDLSITAWGVNAGVPKDELALYISEVSNGSELVLDNNWGFKSPYKNILKTNHWAPQDQILILQSDKTKGLYDLWNINKGLMIYDWTLKTTNAKGPVVTFREKLLSTVLNLEDRLNKRVLAQKEATKAVTRSLLNYTVGMKNQNAPIGVFLFIGPTGVGKTELAKALAEEIFDAPSHLIRLDMSLFADKHTYTRLIGSPPGYINHEEGGQLTEPLKKHPNSVVLLDEFEKASPEIIKMFLSAFDEGFIVDAKGIKVSCKDTLFILTSNLLAEEIGSLIKKGDAEDDVLVKLEPYLIKAFSPEVYNRIEPVIFMPLTQNTMKKLVDILLTEVQKNLKNSKKCELYFDESVKEYLLVTGYHETLGARPLKKLIEKKVVTPISYAIISEEIPDNSCLILYYDEETDSCHVKWHE